MKRAEVQKSRHQIRCEVPSLFLLAIVEQTQ
jgi:hypothetical protein